MNLGNFDYYFIILMAFLCTLCTIFIWLQYNNNSAATLEMVANLHTKKLSDTQATPHATRLPFTETHVVYPQREFENKNFNKNTLPSQGTGSSIWKG